MMPWSRPWPGTSRGQGRPLLTVTDPVLWHGCGTTADPTPAYKVMRFADCRPLGRIVDIVHESTLLYCIRKS
jgi:hypothetical protein